MFEITDNTVLFWSGGLDSTLLLAMLREQPKRFDIVRFSDLLTREQLHRSDELIKQWDLQVFSYPAAQVRLIGDGNDSIAAVFETALGTSRIPLIRDVIDGDMCIADAGNALTMPIMPMEWDTVVIGSRKDDTHWALESVVPSDRFNIGGVQILAPLYEFTREDVKQALRARGLDDSEVPEHLDTGNLKTCSACLRTSSVETVWCPKDAKRINGVDWNPTGNLTAFRQAYSGK